MEMSQNTRPRYGYKRLSIDNEISEDEDTRLMDETGASNSSTHDGGGSVSNMTVHTLNNKNMKEQSTWFVWILSFFAAIGGFLFGYDTGVVSGAMLLLTKRFKLTSLWQEIIVSIAIATAFIGAIFGGFFNNKFGRKATIVLASSLFTVGAVVLGAAENIAMLVVGRAILGLGIGLASMTIPMYIAECSPSHIRGKMVTVNTLFITGGQFIASVIDGGFSYTNDGWRYYSATIIKMGGISDEHEAIWLAALTASINFIFTIVGILAVDRFGRKPLILTSLVGVTISLIILAVGFQLAAVHSPPITQYNTTSGLDNSTCSSYRFCESCIKDTSCGYCFTTSANDSYNGSCLATSTTDSTHSLHGQCNKTNLSGDLVWAYEYCPTSYSWIIIVGLVFYLMFFAPGMGPMPWTYNSEIYPLWARSTGNSLSAATNWLSNLIVSMTFLTLTETLTKYGTYWLFVGICLLALAFFFSVLPETKGKQLEEIETLFDEPWSKCCGSGHVENSYNLQNS
ncbi:hypothetical protein LOTGIDRAFT_171977 [Lottia gigantea]|uniref:Major facilitator superfamily (MFS) profile domain-containing protein n=1 Tax=Lottia gigantea TaxID=225164 RepID=V4CJW6_LOTGI|nr:hypothetical protein LOTGIDRAFT_171977 [Lottia gigantea]ESP02505.1 hypothetical protein LOTGIDRAFT_171977 [Lottia gigantea]